MTATQRAFGNFRSSTPPVVFNLLAINILVCVAFSFLPDGASGWMIEKLALFYPQSPYFMPHQLVTYMFMHAPLNSNPGHLLFNMYALWMFGRILEQSMGSKRFLTYYLVTGIGAGLIQIGVMALEVTWMAHQGIEEISRLQEIMLTPTLGASGAIFGILLAFGMLYPNARLMLIFPPIEMKAKYFVMIYGAVELFFGVSGTMDNVAHFAHLGGMLWGFLLLWYWKKKGKIYY